MFKTYIQIGVFALLAGTGVGWCQSPEASEAEKPPVGEKKKELPFVDIYIVPVGTEPLAQFGQIKSKPKPKKKEEKPDEGATGGGKESDQERAVPTGPKGFVVLQRDPREYPPRALYMKHGDQYVILPCAQNSIGTPIRVPLKSSNLVFYDRKMGSEGKYIYKKYHSHRWTPAQKRLLITITKPLKSKYWTKPQIKTYDISPNRLKGKSLVMVNAGEERVIGLVVNGKARRLKPFGKSTIDSSKGDIELKVGVLTKSNKLHAPQRVSVPNRPNEQMLILAFPCSSMESFRGMKTIRGRIIQDRHRKADLLKPKRGA